MSDRVEVVYTSEYHAELRRLLKAHRLRIADVVRKVRAKGWDAAVRDRTIAPLEGGIWELRVVGHGAAYRVLFFVMPGRSPRLVVLTLCLRKSDSQKMRVLKTAIARAVERRQKWMQQEAAEHER